MVGCVSTAGALPSPAFTILGETYRQNEIKTILGRRGEQTQIQTNLGNAVSRTGRRLPGKCWRGLLQTKRFEKMKTKQRSFYPFALCHKRGSHNNTLGLLRVSVRIIFIDIILFFQIILFLSLSVKGKR